MAVLPPDPIFSIKCPELGALTSLCFHQNQRLLAGTVKGAVSLWDMQTYRQFHYFEAMTEPISYMHHNDDLLFLQQKGGNIQSWSLNNTGYTLKQNYQTSHTAFCKAEYITNKELLAYPKSKNTIGFIHINDETDALTDLLAPSDLELGNITVLKSLNKNDQDYIIAGYESGDLLIWDLRSNKVVNDMKTDEYPMAIDFDLYTNRGICGSPNDKIRLLAFQPRESTNLENTGDITLRNEGVNCLKIRKDRKVFVSGGWDGRIRIYSWKSLRPLAVLSEHKSGVSDIIFSSDKVPIWDCNIMAACGVDSQITFWDLYN